MEVLGELLTAGVTTRLGVRGGDGVPNSDGTPLVHASIGRPEVLRRLIQARSDSVGERPIDLLQANPARVKIREILIEAGALE